LTPEIFEKRLHDSLLHHYENHLIEEKESDNNLQEKFNDMTDSDAKTLLNKKTKPDGNNDGLLKQELPPNKNKQKKLENPPKKNSGISIWLHNSFFRR